MHLEVWRQGHAVGERCRPQPRGLLLLLLLLLLPRDEGKRPKLQEKQAG